ncbi:uncharacterized protein LOC116169079 [Photinus pyralis]|uniref:uncharacterized protein LOC116169079 n=1 Tax=Photinus pyralis TaxID=7054 RepID=UPI0012675CA5|nr:uncharacterized protein LOC116169079 [Photinus pyralis]
MADAVGRPPDILCFKCNLKIANEDFVHCFGVCNKYFHGDCAEVNKGTINFLNSMPCLKYVCRECTERPYHSLIQQLQSTLINSIQNELSACAGNAVQEALEDFNKEVVLPLKYELNVIKNHNLTLSKQLQSLSIEKPVAVPKEKSTPSYSNIVKHNDNKSRINSRSVTKNTNSQNKTENPRSQSSIEIAQSKMINDIVYINSDLLSTNASDVKTFKPEVALKATETPDNDAGEWQKPKSRRNRRPTLTTGTSDSDSTIKGVAKTITYYVSRLHPDTTIPQISEHMKNKSITPTVIQQMPSKYPESYSSFKISIQPEDNELFLSPTTWPKGSQNNGNVNTKSVLHRPLTASGRIKLFNSLSEKDWSPIWNSDMDANLKFNAFFEEFQRFTPTPTYRSDDTNINDVDTSKQLKLDHHLTSLPEVLDVIRSLKNGHSKDLYGTTVNLIKSNSSLYANLLVKLINSTLRDVNKGVPQGSILGPLLFLLYINDLPTSIPHECVCLLYADDTTLLQKDGDPNDLIATSELNLESTAEWCTNNGLDINALKTEKMILTLRRLRYDNPEYVKFLGVRLDPKLDFNSHVDYVTSKLNTNIFVLRRLHDQHGVTIHVGNAYSGYSAEQCVY